MRRAILVCCFSLAASSTALPASFAFEDFASTGVLKLVGNATRADKILRLTSATRQTTGAAWFPHKQPVANGFETSFQFQLTQQGGLGGGADGFAFVLQNSGPSVIAGRGASGGFAVGDGYGNPRSPGIPRSIAIFFDTFRNSEAGDPSGNYIALCTNGPVGQMHWPPPRLAFTRKLKVQLKDRKIHQARIVYQPPVLSVFLDDPGTPVLTSAVDISLVADSGGSAYVGFTASTGSGYENHDILSWSFSAGPNTNVASGLSLVSSNISYIKSACLPDRGLCTPERSVVEERGPGQYHIVLPANLEWGAGIPNPTAQSVVVSNARGTVCWDLKTLGADGCNGPAGNGKSPQPNFIAPGKPPGALVVTTKEGQTFFSVNDHSAGFNDNEGYFEFDVDLKE